MSLIRAWAVKQAGGKLEPFEYDPGPLGDEEVEIAVDYCGICHSDMSLIDNEWGMTAYPFVRGTRRPVAWLPWVSTPRASASDSASAWAGMRTAACIAGNA